MTYGVPEARLAELLTGFEADLPAEIRLAYLPSFGIIKLRLTGTGNDRRSLTPLIDQQVKRLYAVIPELIYGENEEPMEQVTGNILKAKNKTICTAESCTGGNIARMITGIPGCSQYFKGSVVAYDNSVKSSVLGIDREIIEKEGAVSEQVVRLMAEGARSLFKADFSVATSGIAGPDGGTDNKPVGTVWLAVASSTATVTERHIFGTDRIININRFSLAALNLLRKQITGL